MNTFLKLSLTIIAFSGAAVSASDKDLDRALALSRQTNAQEEENRALMQAMTESQRSYQREQENRASEEKKKKETQARQEREHKMREQREREAKQKALDQELIDCCYDLNLARAYTCLLNGANIHARSGLGRTPLAAAIQGSSPTDELIIFKEELIKHLIAKGANINAQDNEGFSIIMQAASAPIQIFKLILDYNPDLTFVNKKNETVVDILKNDAVSSSAAKLLMLQKHVKKIEQEERAKIKTEVQTALMISSPIANLILDYVGQASYPLSDEFALPFTPKIKSQDPIGFVASDSQ